MLLQPWLRGYLAAQCLNTHKALDLISISNLRQARPRDKERGTTSANFVLKFTIKYRDERMYKGSEWLRAVVGKFNRHGMKSRYVTLLGVSQEDA